MGLPHAGGLAAQAGGRTQPLAGPGPGSEPRWSRQDGAGRPAGAAAPCEAGLRPMVCERSGVRVPPVEEACDITPSWLLAGGDPTPGFLPSDVGCDLAEGAKGQNGDAGGAGPPGWCPGAGRRARLVAARGETRGWSQCGRRRPRRGLSRSWLPGCSHAVEASGTRAPRAAVPSSAWVSDSPHMLALCLLRCPRRLGGPQREVPLLPAAEGGARGPAPGGSAEPRAAGCGRPLAEGGASAPTLTFVPFRFASGALTQCRLWPGHSPLPSWRLVQGQGRRGGDPSPGRPPRP